MAPINELEEEFQVNDILSGNSSPYQIKAFIGKGAYGIVALCINLSNNERMAMKIVHKARSWSGEKEVAVLEKLEQFGKKRHNLIRLIEHFTCRNHICLVFEILDISLHDLMYKRRCKPLRLSEIRVIAQQMLVALNALKSINIIHGDIKPDNIMLVNHRQHPFKVKLIDFGLAFTHLRCGTIVQAPSYRAPEVMVGLPLDEAIDMWAVGCVLAFMYLGRHLFAKDSEQEVLKAIVQVVGQPSDNLLNFGARTREFFSRTSARAPWRLITQPGGRNDPELCSLDKLINTNERNTDSIEYMDTQAFLSLLKRMLHVDLQQRITPREALKHCFITTSHFPRDADDEYIESAHSVIHNCQLENASDESTPGFVIVKTRNRWFRTIRRSLSRMIKCVRCFRCVKTTADSESGPPAKAKVIPAKTDRTSGKNAEVPRVPAKSARCSRESETIVESINGSLGTDDSDETPAEKIIAWSDKGPPAKTGLDNIAFTRSDKKPPDTNKAVLPAFVHPKSDGINTSSDDGKTGFVEVKTKKKWFKRIGQFFSRMIKSVNCL